MKAWFVLLYCALCCRAGLSTTLTGRIEVGPNILVSRESVYPKVAIAGTPTSEQCMIYTSLNGGNVWKAIAPPGMPDSGSGDPQVAFGSDGTAYFSAIGTFVDDKGKGLFAAILFRSNDGGLNWEKIDTFGAEYPPDHDMLIVGGGAVPTRFFGFRGFAATIRASVCVGRLRQGRPGECRHLPARSARPGASLHKTPYLNAQNGTAWNGASFDYSAAFGDLSCLAPGDMTEAVIWRVKPIDSKKTFIHFDMAITHEGLRK